MVSPDPLEGTMHPYVAELLIAERTREREEIAEARRLDRLARLDRPRLRLPRRLRRPRPIWNTRVV
jgi:hypothetical protein